MKIIAGALLITAGIFSLNFMPTGKKNLHQLKANTIDGKELALSSFKGKKVLIVNTASECGYTPQYAELEQLYNKYKSSGFEIIGFPSNDFGGQEPGTNQEIKTFCKKNYNVTFTMMEKITVKGSSIHPVYKWLTSKEENGINSDPVKWNFHKFLIDENGNLVKALPSSVKPMSSEITSWITQK
jgi:glutathione peroxidase